MFTWPALLKGLRTSEVKHLCDGLDLGIEKAYWLPYKNAAESLVYLRCGIS